MSSSKRGPSFGTVIFIFIVVILVRFVQQNQKMILATTLAMAIGFIIAVGIQLWFRVTSTLYAASSIAALIVFIVTNVTSISIGKGPTLALGFMVGAVTYVLAFLALRSQTNDDTSGDYSTRLHAISGAIWPLIVLFTFGYTVFYLVVKRQETNAAFPSNNSDLTSQNLKVKTG
jgi:hypothetical protein